MQITTKLNEFLELSKNQEKIIVCSELAIDKLSITNCFRKILAYDPEASLLETSGDETSNKYYSFIAFNLMAKISVSEKQMEIKEKNQEKHLTTDDPFGLIREYQKQYYAASNQENLGFSGGLMGFFSYGAARLIEKLPEKSNTLIDIPDILIKFYRDHVIFDHQRGKVILTTIVSINIDPEQAYHNACLHLHQLYQKFYFLNQAENKPIKKHSSMHESAKIERDNEKFKEIIEKAKYYIKQGEIFQVVLSRCFTLPFSGDPIEIYEALQTHNPSPYLFFLKEKNYILIGSSPEKVVSLQQNNIEIVPLAGTKPRGKTSVADQALMQALASDPKEIAEHMMLVDLARNDLGKISLPGSIDIEDLRTIKLLSKVMHLASNVKGKLDKRYDAFDVLNAAFPAGTLTGAPKIRAMEIIHELEDSDRGAYGGAVFYIDRHGNLDSCIAIRMAMLCNNLAIVRAGAGIVADSDPQHEADETYHKASAVLAAIAQVERN